MHEFGTCKENAAAQCQNPTNLAAKHVLKSDDRKSAALCSSRILFASHKFIYRLRSGSPLHFDMRNIYHIREEKCWNASARRLLPTAMLERWPQVCHVKITFRLLLNRGDWFVSTKWNRWNDLSTVLHEFARSFRTKPNPVVNYSMVTFWKPGRARPGRDRLFFKVCPAIFRFSSISTFFFRFSPFFCWKVVQKLLHLLSSFCFPTPESVQNTQKIPLLHITQWIKAKKHEFELIRKMRWSADFSRMIAFSGEKGHDLAQNKNLETRIKTPRGTPKNRIQCRNPPAGAPNFKWRAAAALLWRARWEKSGIFIQIFQQNCSTGSFRDIETGR